MNFADRIAVRLGDPATRAGVLDEPALEAVAAAGYDAALLGIEGPYSAQFEELRLGNPQPSTTTADGTWAKLGSPDRTEASFVVTGPGGQGPRIDALWRGAVIARVAHDRSTITAADTSWTAPPGEPAVRATASVDVAFSTAPPPTPAPMSLPIAAPLLVRDADVSIAELLADSGTVRERLDPLGLERPNPDALPRRVPLPVVWVLPLELFDDPDWPGAASGMNASEARAARRAAAAAWLADQGVALAAVTT